MDPFAILGMARSFDLDLDLVERTHRQLARAVHPDRFAGAGATERREAMARAIDVNEAWRTLRDPLRRAEALLTLRGLVAPDGREPPPSPSFLADMLEQREALSEAKGGRDLDAVRLLGAAAHARSSALERELARRLTDGDGEPLLATLGEMRFYRRFLDEVAAVEDGLA